MSLIRVFALGASLLLPLGSASAAPTQGHAGFVDAAKLMEICSANEDVEPILSSVCLGYVVGAVDEMLAEDGGEHRIFCMPDDLRAQDLVEVLRAQGSSVADEHSLSGADFLRFVFEQAYPCQVTFAPDSTPPRQNGMP